MEAYIGGDEGFGSGEHANQRRFDQVTSYSSALELAYREIAELKDKLAQQKLYCGPQRLDSVVAGRDRHRKRIDRSCHPRTQPP